MNPPSPRHQAALQAAAQRVKNAAREAAQRCVDSLGLAALSSLKIRERDDFLAAQFELNRRQAQFGQAFDDILDRRIERETTPRHDSSRDSPPTAWESLSLVEDHEVEANISAERFGLAIQHACEWELRELDAYMGSLLRLGSPDHDRNPLRPELVGQALVIAVEAVSERPEVRKLLAAEIGRGLASSMPKVYGDIVADLRASGLQPVSLALRTGASPGHGHESSRHTSGYGNLSQSGDMGTGGGSGSSGGQGPGGGAWQPSSGPGGGASVHGGTPSGRGSTSGHPSGFGGGGTPIGQVDAQLMTLIRRLASLGPAGFEQMSSGAGGEFAASMPGGAPSTGGSGMPMVAPNLIYAHRDELRQASTGTLDHMVIDVVGSLFEQILSDPKVSPQMARQIARLQLPVLRVALGDTSFFSSRRHPVRRFVNRIASLACSFDDFSEGPGLHFLGLVRELVQEIVAGDFDQMEVYEQKLDALERFIAEQASREVEEQGANAVEMLEAKEHDLRVQQRYMRQLQSALATMDMQDFLREFLTQVWSQALVQAARRGGESGDLAQRLKRAGRELVMSVQPKGSPADRKNFLMQLPQLMKDLNDGLVMIGWPEAAKKNFFAQLLPAHAESLKGQSMRQLDYNMMVKQLDAILASPLPQSGTDMPRFADGLPVLDDAVDNVRFSPEEAEQIGLVAESAINWAGQIDIDLSAEPELTEVDINLDGLPPAEPVEPMRGASLANHVQLGFSYQMHLEDQWQKVKLSYVSPGRAFFVFIRGKKHQKTISLTARMLHRLCDTNRLRAFENAFLIERATARARKQLAELKAGAAVTTRQ
jgi:hypothetical protein